MRFDFGSRYLRSNTRTQFLPNRKRLFEARRLKNLASLPQSRKFVALLRRTKLASAHGKRTVRRIIDMLIKLRTESFSYEANGLDLRWGIIDEMQNPTLPGHN